ncbi:MAG: cyclase family protein [Planctomycetes bacterium]|nr:cyclase family protein [Planctomycetota bacterium]MBI3843367.1 cyclase family protein [Planctomycetota bacterium]
MSFDPVRLVRLSYDLGDDTPPFGDGEPIAFPHKRRIRDGDVCNSRLVHGSLHSGTHVDAPLHFGDDMPAISELPTSAFFFRRPVIVDVPKDDFELIGPDDLRRHAAAIEHADFVAVRTGFARHRASDPHRFSRRGPGFAADAADFLLEAAPILRALAIDTVSAASYQHVDEGAEFHRRMLGREPGDRFVLLVEDVNLGEWRFPFVEIWIAPLFVRDADGAPCTIYGLRP